MSLAGQPHRLELQSTDTACTNSKAGDYRVTVCPVRLLVIASTLLALRMALQQRFTISTRDNTPDVVTVSLKTTPSMTGDTRRLFAGPKCCGNKDSECQELILCTATYLV